MAHAKYTEYLSPKFYKEIHEQYCPRMEGENKAHWFLFQSTDMFPYGISTVWGFQRVSNSVDISLRP